MQWEIKEFTRKRPQGPEKAWDEVEKGFRYASDWWKGNREFGIQITEISINLDPLTLNWNFSL